MSTTARPPERPLAPPTSPLPPASTRARPDQRGVWVGVPTRKDPRIVFAGILTLYAAVGAIAFGFNRSPLQMLVIVAAGCLLDMLLHFMVRERKLLVPLSSYITALSLALILNFSHDYLVLLFPVSCAVASKYVLTFKGRHAYNPSLFGVVASLVVAGTLITAAPAYQWGEWWYVSPFMVLAAFALFVTKVNRIWLVGSFLLFYTLQTALRAFFLRYHVPAEVLFVGTLTQPPFFLFTFFMITDPRTSPDSRRGQVLVALAITLVDLFFHTRQSVFTFFYAAAVVASTRFAWNHLSALRAAGPGAHLRASLSRKYLRAATVVGALALAGFSAYAVARPHVTLSRADAGFALRELPASRTGIEVTMDPSTLELPDRRIHNVSKWLLSVGAATAAGDLDADGQPDLVLINPLARAADRVQLWRNAGNLRFELVPLPQLGTFDQPKTQGLPSGALVLDYDQDGRQDILVLVSFGQSQLLRNTSSPSSTSTPTFDNVTDDAGLPDYTISVAANAIDFDRDGDPDIALGNVLPEYLKGYDPPQRLNIFDLPESDYPGDQRMYRFMHASWDNATNGGKMVLLENDGDGTFTEHTGASLGMTETHYHLSIGTGDLNGDGFTDIYSASDFGRDDLYINEGGKRFRRVQGRFYGSVGKDTYKGMNSTVADLDRNGQLDVYVSNDHHALQAEGSLLWMNQGLDGHGSEHLADGRPAGDRTSRSDASARRAMREYPAPRLRDEATGRGALNENRFGWGAAAGDLNNDGWADLVQANGMVGDVLDNRYKGCPDYWYVNHKMMSAGPELHTYTNHWGDLRGRCIFPDELRRVYLNRGTDTRPQFVDVARTIGVMKGDNSRGVAMIDLDSDGWLDVVIANQHRPPTVLRTEPVGKAARRHWIGLKLEGDGRSCSRGAYGSTVEVARADAPGGKRLLREVQGANGFSAQGDPRLHFGLGAHAPNTIHVRVRWCGADTATTYELTRDGYHVVRQAGRFPNFDDRFWRISGVRWRAFAECDILSPLRNPLRCR